MAGRRNTLIGRRIFREIVRSHDLSARALASILEVSEYRANQLHAGRLTLTPEEIALLGDVGHAFVATLRYALIRR